MSDEDVNGARVSVRSLTEGEDDYARYLEWLKDSAHFLEAAQLVNQHNSVYFHRVIAGSSTVVCDVAASSMFEPAQSAAYGTLVNDHHAFTQLGLVFFPVVFVRTVEDFGSGYNEYNLVLDVEDTITVQVDVSTTPGTVRLTNTTASSVVCFVVLLHYNPSFMPDPSVVEIQ